MFFQRRASQNSEHILQYVTGRVGGCEVQAAEFSVLISPPPAWGFWYTIHCQNGNVIGLIASRREPPRRGRQDRPSVANRSSENHDFQKAHAWFARRYPINNLGCRLVVCLSWPVVGLQKCMAWRAPLTKTGRRASLFAGSS